MSTITDSILNGTKKALGLDSDYTAFDPEIIMHINSTFNFLNQLGIGSIAGFMIEDSVPVWADFLRSDVNLNAVKTYMFLKVRSIFDPPGTSYAVAAMQDQIRELEWRLNVYRENTELTINEAIV